MTLYYFAVQILEGQKMRACVYRFAEYHNIAAHLSEPEVVAANICPTKKRAYELANAWNKGFAESGILA